MLNPSTVPLSRPAWVPADPKGVVEQVEHAGDHITGEGWGAETHRDTEDPRAGAKRRDLDAHRRQRHQHGDGDVTTNRMLRKIDSKVRIRARFRASFVFGSPGRRHRRACDRSPL